ncbi:MAG: zf-HC2 domain-containing protein [Chloroflexi bacterium]|nr:zf-HC2 domain-containing protein [Chloroflexota bacterium]
MRDANRVPMIDCHEAARRLYRFVDRELSAREEAEVRLHLEACENCRMLFRFEDGLRRLVRNAAQKESAPASLRDRIRQVRLQ